MKKRLPLCFSLMLALCLASGCTIEEEDLQEPGTDTGGSDQGKGDSDSGSGDGDSGSGDGDSGSGGGDSGSGDGDSGSGDGDSGSGGGDSGSGGGDSGSGGGEPEPDPTKTLSDYHPSITIESTPAPQAGTGYEADFGTFKAIGCVNGNAEVESTNGNTFATTPLYQTIVKDITAGTMLAGQGVYDPGEEVLSHIHSTERTIAAYRRFQADRGKVKFVAAVDDEGNLLTDIAKAAWVSDGALGLRQACGSHYVAEVGMATEFYLVATLTFKSTANKSQFTEFVGLTSPLQPLTINDAKMAINALDIPGINVEFRAVLRGGDRTRLPDGLAHLLDTPQRCSLRNESCKELLADMAEIDSSDVTSALTSGGQLPTSVTMAPVSDVLVGKTTEKSRGSYTTSHMQGTRQAIQDTFFSQKALKNALDREFAFMTQRQESRIANDGKVQTLVNSRAAANANIAAAQSTHRECYEAIEKCGEETLGNLTGALLDVELPPGAWVQLQQGTYAGAQVVEEPARCQVPYMAVVVGVEIPSDYTFINVQYRTVEDDGDLDIPKWRSCSFLSDGTVTIKEQRHENTDESIHGAYAPDGAILTGFGISETEDELDTVLARFAPWLDGSRHVGQQQEQTGYGELNNKAQTSGSEHITGVDIATDKIKITSGQFY